MFFHFHSSLLTLFFTHSPLPCCWKGVVPGFIKDQAQKYWRTCGATIDKFEAGDAVPVMDAMCTTGCHMLALWADFDGVGEPWYRAFRTWLVNATTSDGATKCLM